MPVAQQPIDLDEHVVMNGGNCYQMFWLTNVLTLEVEGKVIGASNLTNLGQLGYGHHGDLGF